MIWKYTMASASKFLFYFKAIKKTFTKILHLIYICIYYIVPFKMLRNIRSVFYMNIFFNNNIKKLLTQPTGGLDINSKNLYMLIFVLNTDPISSKNRQIYWIHLETRILLGYILHMRKPILTVWHAHDTNIELFISIKHS